MAASMEVMEEISDSDNDVSDKKTAEGNLSDSDSDNEEIAQLKSELSTIPFCELQALRDKIGVKKFNEAIHGFQKVDKKKNTETFKRITKNRPREMSSKRPVSRFKRVKPAAKTVSRDPRFDDLSGHFNEHMFDKAYSFLDDVRTQEKQQIKKAIKLETNTEKKVQLHSLLKRMGQAEKQKIERKRRKEKSKERRKEELTLIKQGKKPFYLKKSEKKKMELAEKYKMLKESKKLDQYLKKKRKKNASKERKHLPNERQ